MRRESGVLKTCGIRVFLIFTVFSIFFVIILVKLFTVQVLQRSYWKKQALAQHFGQHEIPSKRGEILASDGFPIVITSTKYDLFIDPQISEKDFTEFQEVFDYLYKSRLVDQEIEKTEDSSEEDKQSIDDIAVDLMLKEQLWRESLDRKDKRFIYLEKGLSEEDKNYISSLGFKELGFVPVVSRVYPEKEVYSHILGFVGSNEEGKNIGYFGLEGFYEGDLSGVSGYVLQEESALGSPILFTGADGMAGINGSNLKTTVDRYMQSLVYEELKSSVESYGAESGVVIIIDPNTGAILTMANYPSYEPSKYYEYYEQADTQDIFINKATSHTYEPGSVIKALTMSAAIDLGVVSPNTTMTDGGPVIYSTHKVDNWDGKHHGEITMTEVLQLSNNIGAAWVGTKVGSKNLYEYFDKFNLNSPLAIDLEGEEAGSLRMYDEWRDIDLATASFGQGISTTPLQVAAAFAAIANGGVLMQPYIVSEIETDGKIVKNEPKEIRRVISKDSSEIMVKMLTKAVVDGEAKYFVSKKYNVAGKTGTAQISERGEYLEDKTNVTFVGFLPNYREFVMLVKFEKPTSSVYASETAVPTWMNIAEKLANYSGFPPDRYE